MASRYGADRTMSYCRMATGSITMAQKARRVLSSDGIGANVVKLSSDRGKGCIYGLEFPCGRLAEVKAILHRAGIEPDRI